MKVKKDKFGLYVRTGGYVFRPVKSTSSYEISHAKDSREDGSSYFREGDHVVAKHMAQTPFAKVRDQEFTVIEWWHSHGSYCAPVRHSYECWKPVKVCCCGDTMLSEPCGDCPLGQSSRSSLS